MAYKELVGIIPGDSSDERRTCPRPHSCLPTGRRVGESGRRATNDELLDPQKLHQKIERLSSFNVIASEAKQSILRSASSAEAAAKAGTTKDESLSKAAFIESEIRRFLKGYANRRYSKPSLERTAFVLSRLTDHPVYYIWFNPNLSLNVYGIACPTTD